MATTRITRALDGNWIDLPTDDADTIAHAVVSFVGSDATEGVEYTAVEQVDASA